MIDKFKSRKFLLALFAQVVGLLILFYPEHESAIESAATNVSALLLMALTAGGWLAAEGKVDAARMDAMAKVEQVKIHTESNERSKAQPDPSAKQRPSAADAFPDDDTPAGKGLMGIGLAVLLMLGVGCQLTPEQRWYSAQDSLNTARSVVLTAHASGLISDRDLLAIDPIEKSVRAALDAAKEALDSGATDRSVDFYLGLAEQTLTRLITHLERTKRDGERTGTSPAGSGQSPGADRGGNGNDQPDRTAGGGFEPDRGRKADHPGGEGSVRIGMGQGGCRSRAA